MGALLGGLTALAIGVSDMFGRKVTAASSPITATAVMQLFATAMSLLAITFVASTFRTGDFALGAASGVGMGGGLACYFGGLRVSSSAVVAPVVATLSAVIPYLYTLAAGTTPSAIALIGALTALAGLVLVTTGGSSRERVRAGLAWGLASGLSYGAGLTFVIETSSASGVWPTVGQRVTAFALMIALAQLLRVPAVPPPGLRGFAAAAGLLAAATSLLYIGGVQIDPQPTVVTSSLFPIASVTGGWLIYRDDVSPTQVAGIAVGLAGVIGIIVG